MTLQVRALQPQERDWANARYREIDFLPSPPADYLGVAELDGQPAGLGRLTTLAPGVGELGGMYVFPAYRGCGAAGALITHLIARFGPGTLYCLPFQELQGLYAAAGFSLRAVDATVPAKILQKHQWCNHHYPQPVLLMCRQG